ncbi:MAG TPA: 5-oxoprolinase subunit PxpB [Burkholderiales bacterium]|nr:5-oxoprolinase subunit PxpB [Burkholderiales bacterium]
MKTGRRAGPRVSPLGDGAILLTVADALELEANALARRVALEIRGHGLAWVTDVIPALVTVAVCFDARTAREAGERRATLERMLLEALDRAAGARADAPARTVDIPVCYEPAFAPDLPEVARQTGLPHDRIVALHVAAPHRVLMIGFAPGHPYIGGLDPQLAVPRPATPRLRVEAGSVAIANTQTSIYPFATPGGWNVIDRTPLALFDPERDPASLLEPGDAVAFVPIVRAEFERIAREQRTP